MSAIVPSARSTRGLLHRRHAARDRRGGCWRARRTRRSPASRCSPQADFSEPGELAFFINPPAGDARRDDAQGACSKAADGRRLRATLRAQRPDLAAHRQPVPQGPARPDDRPDGLERRRHAHALAHALREYLYRLYLDNELATNRFPVEDGKTVRLSDITVPMFVVGTEADHVAPGSRSTRSTTWCARTTSSFPCSPPGAQRRHRRRPGAPEAPLPDAHRGASPIPT